MYTKCAACVDPVIHLFIKASVLLNAEVQGEGWIKTMDKIEPWN